MKTYMTPQSDMLTLNDVLMQDTLTMSVGDTAGPGAETNAPARTPIRIN